MESKKQLSQWLKESNEKNDRLERNHVLEIKDLEAAHGLELKEKDFQLNHLESATIKTLNEEIQELKQNNAVLEAKNEALDKILDLNADIVDVKDLVKNLIDKLPKIDLTNLTVNAPSK